MNLDTPNGLGVAERQAGHKGLQALEVQASRKAPLRQR